MLFQSILVEMRMDDLLRALEVHASVYKAESGAL